MGEWTHVEGSSGCRSFNQYLLIPKEMFDSLLMCFFFRGAALFQPMLPPNCAQSPSLESGVSMYYLSKQNKIYIKGMERKTILEEVDQKD